MSLRMKPYHIPLFSLLLGVGIDAVAQDKYPVQPSDCVNVRYLSTDFFHRPIQINPQGTRFAYLVKSPNIATDHNDVQIYTRHVGPPQEAEQKPILVGQNISEMRWLSDGIHLALLIQYRGHTAVGLLDAITGQLRILASAQTDIQEYSIDESENTIAYALEEQGNGEQLSLSPTVPPSKEDIEKGYRIPMEPPSVASYFPHRRVYLMHRIHHSSWSTPTLASIEDPFTGRVLTSFPYHQRLALSLSPNGRYLLLRYIAGRDHLPRAWQANAWLNHAWDGGFPGVPVQVVYHFPTRQTSIPFPSPFALSVPIWSKESDAFAVVAESPVGSTWADEEAKNGTFADKGMHLFMVNVLNHEVQKIADHVASTTEQPLLWRDSRMWVHASGDTVSVYSHDADVWRQESAIQLPLPGLQETPQLATDGRYIIGDYQTPLIPPSLFLFRVGDSATKIIQQLNPEFAHLQLPKVEQVTWKTSTGFPITGVLLLPPDAPSRRPYPLVIQTKVYGDQFLCDTGETHYPSFVPVPLADAGIAYLMRTYPSNYQYKDELEHYPKNYPDGIREAAFQMDIWDSAVAMLAERGIIDKQRVGIIGFSRSGWYTEFALTHGKTPFAAATTTDNIEFSLSEYWLLHTRALMREYENVYGGPPYGAGLTNWLKYSISFNLDKIHAPLLMEEMGYGIPYQNRFATPYNLAAHFELFTGLNRLAKPVELYYYPTETHILDHPQARLATLQRNLDWYRFWLQHYERPAPEDPDQYPRWRQMRNLLH